MMAQVDWSATTLLGGFAGTGEATIATLGVDEALVGQVTVLNIDPFAALALQDAHSALAA